jgi:lipopolysaccharide transport system permease protein/teichoic acid transport system permease protein
MVGAGLLRLARDLIQYNHLLRSLARREVSSMYVGSFLGFIWTFIQPAVMIVVFWFVFSVGFKAKPLSDVPFVVWLTAGIAPWYLFSAIAISCSTVIIQYGHLIKKTVFPSQILVAVKILSNMVAHGAFTLLLIVLILFNSMPLSVYYFQVFYYLVCLVVLASGIGWLTSSINVYARDMGQLVPVVVQVGFWVTPIFWDISIMPERVQFWLKINPFYYIVQGYRDSFIDFVPFWQHGWYTLYFWTFSIFTLLAGGWVFRKLKPQFVDVL